MTAAAIDLADLPAPVPEWVQLLPAPDADGMIRARDGRAWRLDDPAALAARSSAQRADLPVDFDHTHDKPDLAGDAERLRAAGWITALEVRDGALWAKVSWTDRAAEMIARREWRYMSPVIAFDPKSRAVLKLLGAGLVARAPRCTSRPSRPRRSRLRPRPRAACAAASPRRLAPSWP